MVDTKASAISVRITASMNPSDPKSTRMTNPYLHSSPIITLENGQNTFWRFLKKSPKIAKCQFWHHLIQNQNKQK